MGTMDGGEGDDRAGTRCGRRAFLTGAGLAAAAAVAASTAAAGSRPSPFLGAVPDGLSAGARATESAVRVDPPLPPGAYDREALYVALYGFPGSAVLGALGEQGIAATIDRVRGVAAGYAGFGRRVVPTFEIIASVASSTAGSDGDYSHEFPPDRFLPWVDAAGAAEMHVVFDLQPGRSTFPQQAREYEDLWLRPNVSIALDPEWRVGPTERPGGGRIGSVSAAEVNASIGYLDDLVRRHGLPPKMCIVHQFTPSMITDKQLIRGTDHVQVVNQMDGFGTLTLKRGSWARMVADLPPGAFTGWKNFYDEDRPTPTPAETMVNRPTPRYVSHQ